MYQKVLVPLDGSELAEVVLPYAKDFAGKLGLDLIVFVVSEQGDATSLSVSGKYAERIVEELRQQLKGYRPEAACRVGWKEPDVRAEVAAGYPPEEILRHALDEQVDLILLATHGRSGIRRWVLGNVADKVLRASSVPVLLIRAANPGEVIHNEFSMNSILIPLDGSRLSESIISHVEVLAKQYGARMTNVFLLRICEEPLVTADYPEANKALSWNEHIRHIDAHMKQICEYYLQGIERRLKYSGLNVHWEYLYGKPSDQIIDYANNKHIDLVMMSSHGYSGFTAREFGNVTDKVLHEVRIPLFLIKPDGS